LWLPVLPMDSAAKIFLTPLYFLLPFQMMILVVLVMMMISIIVIVIIIGKDNRPAEDFDPSTAISAVRWSIIFQYYKSLFETRSFDSRVDWYFGTKVSE